MAEETAEFEEPFTAESAVHAEEGQSMVFTALSALFAVKSER
jgi:hypothetical protein